MKNQTLLITLTLLALTFAGCSKHSPDTTTATEISSPIQASTNIDSVIQVGTNHYRLAKIITRATKATDLGIVEVSDGIPIQQSLGGSRACVITPTVFTNGSVRLSIAIVETNSAGVVETLATPRVQNMAGQPVMVSVGDIAIRLTPKIKP
jgi:hypothetical protein